MRKTLYDKLWDAHVVTEGTDGSAILYVDRQLIHEVSTPQAFHTMRAEGRKVRQPLATLAVVDHAVPTDDRREPIREPQAFAQIERLYGNAETFGIPLIRLEDEHQGIVHVIGPELGFTLPGITLACSDSHTSTHGAFGALAFGIGASECAIVMATQCLVQHRARRMRVTIVGALHPLISAKDLSLALIAAIGADGARGYAVEYTGPCVAAMSMEARMTLCNMSIEAGANVGMVAPDETTFAYLRGLPMAPSDAHWDMAVAYWRTLRSDHDAVFDAEVELDASSVAPHVTWGTSPQDAAPIDTLLPDPDAINDPARRLRTAKALAYMDLHPGGRLEDIAIDKVFIGSCTNGRIEDLRAAADIIRGRMLAPTVTAMVVPGSTQVKRQAEREGLDRIFVEAGFEWREAGCSMCVAMNQDRLKPGERCAATTNRNFEGRQGVGGRTHLMSPAMAAAAGLAGHLVDIRTWEG